MYRWECVTDMSLLSVGLAAAIEDIVHPEAGCSLTLPIQINNMSFFFPEVIILGLMLSSRVLTK